MIKANSGLSDEEIDKMVKDAEAHADEDRKFEELAQVRNTADALVHSTQKTLKEHGDKATDEEKQAIETAIQDVEEALKADDVDAINAKVEALTQASSALAQKIYADQSADAGAEQAEGTADSTADDAVDAEFEEVKDNK